MMLVLMKYPAMVHDIIYHSKDFYDLKRDRTRNRTSS